MIIGVVVATGALLAAVYVVGNSWFQLVLAAMLGLVMAQVGFLSHEAAHRSIFSSAKWNEWVSRVLGGLLLGLSYQWWLNKHSVHHANPNKLGHDPDIDSKALALTPEATDARTGLAARLSKWQGFYFPALLFFEGLVLYGSSIKIIFTAPGVKRRWVEITFVSIRWVAYLAFLFIVLSPALAVAFVAVQIGVFGFLLGGAFATNHIGMPIVARDADIDFLRRQVLMSRNVRGGIGVHFFLGGLEYQIEHHLFPTAPRPNLPALRLMVREFCDENGVEYTETSLGEALATVVAYLNQVGLKNRDPFTCPLVRELRG